MVSRMSTTPSRRWVWWTRIGWGSENELRRPGRRSSKRNTWETVPARLLAVVSSHLFDVVGERGQGLIVLLHRGRLQLMAECLQIGAPGHHRDQLLEGDLLLGVIPGHLTPSQDDEVVPHRVGMVGVV